VIPHILKFDVWNDRVKSMGATDEFVFLFLGTWRKRKGWEALLEAWFSEFGPDEKVRLVIKTDKSDRAAEDISRIKKNLGKKETAPISLERRLLNEEQIASFVKSAHCYVSSTLGEGFGLPALQAIALGVPVIITNFSGCQEYATADNCTLLEPSGFLVHECIDPVPQFAYKKWPRIKVSTIRTAMRGVIQDYQKAQEKADKAYRFVHDNFGYKTFILKFDDMMEKVYNGGCSQTQTIQRHARRV
jgi:glycosyltransferase involved in cell wall biosynthesis